MDLSPLTLGRGTWALDMMSVSERPVAFLSPPVLSLGVKVRGFGILTESGSKSSGFRVRDFKSRVSGFGNMLGGPRFGIWSLVFGEYARAECGRTRGEVMSLGVQDSGG